MNKQTLAIILIIATGSIVSIAYATSTVISDSGIITPSLTATTLTVTGTCSGCGAGEGSFTNYNTVLFNNTLPIIRDGSPPVLFISNNGTVTWDSGSTSLVVTDTGTIIKKGTSGFFGANNQNGQSLTGVYKILQINNGTGSFTVIKNESVLQVLGLNGAQFNFGLNSVSMAISPNGKFIVFGGEDPSTGMRMVILQGS